MGPYMQTIDSELLWAKWGMEQGQGSWGGNREFLHSAIPSPSRGLQGPASKTQDSSEDHSRLVSLSQYQLTVFKD